MTDKQEIKLPEPVGTVAPRPDVVDWFSYEPEIGTELHEAATVRRLIAEAVAAEREACAQVCESRAPCNGRMDEWDAAAVTCAAAIRARSAAKSAGELPPTDRSAETAAHPGIHALGASPRAGGLACDRLPFGVPPGGLEREGFVPASDHQSGHRDIVRGPGVLGGLAAERSDDGGMAEGVKDGE